MQRWQGQLLGPEFIDSLSAEKTRVSDAVRRQIVSVLGSMDSSEREAVEDYFATESVSERALARKHGVSRYRIRELLVQGLAKLMTGLHRPPLIKVWDWNVAIESWQNGRTNSEIGSLLSATVREVHQSLTRTRMYLAAGLGSKVPQRLNKEMREEMEASPTPESLLTQTLSSPGDQALLQQLKADSRKVLAFLSTGTFEPESGQFCNIEEEWLAQVYEALAGEEIARDLSEEETQVLQAIAGEERDVGCAFREALVADLPIALQDPGVWLGNLQPVSGERQGALLLSPSVVPESVIECKMAEKGITPLSVYLAIEAISEFLLRTIESGHMDTGQTFHLSAPDGRLFIEPESAGVEHSILISEIEAMAECGEAAAEALALWLIDVAAYKPLLLDGFQASRVGERITLEATGRHERNLFRRWVSIPTPLTSPPLTPPGNPGPVEASAEPAPGVHIHISGSAPAVGSMSRLLAVASQCKLETLRFGELNRPGTYYMWNTGGICRIPEEALKASHGPSLEIKLQGDDRVTRLSDDPFLPLSKARLIAAQAELEVNF